MKNWNNYKQYTDFTIGEKNSSTTNSPFGNFFKENHKGYEYRQEDGLVDISFYKKEYYKNIFNLYDPKKLPEKYDLINLNDQYPIYYDILVEHENDITRCYEEMIKLTAFRSDLKVLITYNWDKEENDNFEYVNDTLIKNFKNIISQSNKYNPETKDIEYLLIIGQLNIERDNVEWSKITIDGTGRLHL